MQPDWGDFRQRKVLVAEDQTAEREYIAQHLKLSGFEVIEAAGGDEAMALVQACRPDLLVLDITMPGIFGTEVLQRLRGAGDLTPIILWD